MSIPEEVKDPTQGVNVQPVVDSIILPGQYILHDVDQKECKGKGNRTAFSFCTCVSDLRSPKSTRNASTLLNCLGSRKLSRLKSSSTLFCNGVPVNRIRCSWGTQWDKGVKGMLHNNCSHNSSSSIGKFNALASNALYHYRNAVLRNCNALFDFQMTLFYVLDNLVFAVRALLAKIVALFAKIIR